MLEKSKHTVCNYNVETGTESVSYWESWKRAGNLFLPVGLCNELFKATLTKCLGHSGLIFTDL